MSVAVPVAQATEASSIDFSGELDYETFARAASQGTSVRIRRSPGGTGAAAMALGRTRGLVIDGACHSACAWAFVQNESACFTRRASFAFHGAHDPGTGRRLTIATEYWLSKVRPALRPQLAGLRTSSGIIRLSAGEMTRYYGDRLCGSVTSDIQVPRATALSLAESRAAEEALRHAAFQGGSVIVTASLVRAGASETDRVAAKEAMTCFVCAVIPALSPEFRVMPAAAARANAVLWGGVVASTMDRIPRVALASSGAAYREM